MVHKPGPELDRMLPENLEAHRQDTSGVWIENPDYLLFDDLVQLSRLRTEHAVIQEVLRATCGKANTLLFRDRVRALLHAEEARERTIEEIVKAERALYKRTISPAHVDSLGAMDPQELTQVFLSGCGPDGAQYLSWPAPNVLFARDLGAVVGEHILLTYAKKPARYRDMILSRAMFEMLPEFAGTRCLDIGELVADPAIEGGDVIVLSEDKVAIGVGQRTTWESAKAAANLLLKAGIQAVYLVEIQEARSTMHLDTVFTFVDFGLCLLFTPLMAKEGQVQTTSLTLDDSGAVKETKRKGLFLEVLREDGLELDVIPCGGDDPVHQAREQWSDGANAFALGPGKILLYARNERTLQNMNAFGFRIVTPEELIRNATYYLDTPELKIVVAVEGPELSRGRGGPRCLTLPLVRGTA